MRSALFVDAGYLLTEGGHLALGNSLQTSKKRRRQEIGVRYCQLAAWLADEATKSWGDTPLLRTYWYDGAPRRALTVEHDIIAQHPFVTIRLGSLNAQGQKGVDALIYRDMITLARERAITRAYVVSGDEDLYEGVRAIQDVGVQVVLIGVPNPLGKRNQSEVLCREVDQVIQLDAADLREHFFAPRFVKRPPQPASASDAEIVGEQLGQDWSDMLSDLQLSGLAASKPVIPRRLDEHLLSIANKQLTGVSPAYVGDLRRGFWDAVEAAVAARGT